MLIDQWEAAEYLITHYGAVIIPLSRPGGKSKNPGKVPQVKGWTSLPKTTIAELEKMKMKYAGHNIGLVLGSQSGIVAVDIDGYKGEQIYLNLGGDRAPDTVSYRTGMGKRYLFKIPDQYRDRKFEKYKETVKGEDHEECAFLGDGQLTVMPLCTHKNGQRYSFIEGKELDEIEIAEMPQFMIDLMLKNTKESNKESVEKRLKHGEVQIPALDKCWKFQEALKLQKDIGLDEDDWYLWINLMVSAGLVDESFQFSMLSSKHDERSEERIKLLLKEKSDSQRSFIRCSSFGCLSPEVEDCHGILSKNENGEVTNSPYRVFDVMTKVDIKVENDEKLVEQHVKTVEDAIVKMVGGDQGAYLDESTLESLVYLDDHAPYEYHLVQQKLRQFNYVSKEDVERRIKQHRNRLVQIASEKNYQKVKSKLKIGLIYNPKTGQFGGVNGNRFARHILNVKNMVLRAEEYPYLYESGVYRIQSPFKFMKLIRDELHRFEPDRWNYDIHEIVEKPLLMEMRDSDDLLPAKNIINLQNGLVDMVNLERKEHTSEYFTTSQLAIKFDPTSQCPQFIDFLRDVTEDDEDLIKLIQEMMGYCISYEVRAEKIFILLGEGSNGKSLLTKIMVELCGEENVSTVSMSKLGKTFSTFQMVDKLLNVSTENEIGTDGLNTEELKAIASGDLISAEKKFKDAFPFKPYVKMLFAANRLPYSRDKSYGLERRLIIIPFNKQYVTNPTSDRQGKIDPFMFEKLLKEMPGILNFAIQGFKRLYDNNFVFTESKKSNEILGEYKQEINPILDFFKNAVRQTDSEDRVSTDELYEGFQNWCEANNYRNQKNTGKRKFLREFRSILKVECIDYFEKPSNGKTFFYKLRLKAKYTLVS